MQILLRLAGAFPPSVASASYSATVTNHDGGMPPRAGFGLLERTPRSMHGDAFYVPPYLDLTWTNWTRVLCLISGIRGAPNYIHLVIANTFTCDLVILV